MFGTWHTKFLQLAGISTEQRTRRSIQQDCTGWNQKETGRLQRKVVEELPNVLCTFRTTPRRSTGETLFSLAYGSEAVIPLEIGLPTLRTSEWEPTRNDQAQSQALDLLEERREQTMIRLASYQQQLKKGYNKNVRPRSFQQGDLVLRKVLGNTNDPNDGKLGLNWEGPYQVRSVTGVGAYHLEDLTSVPLLRPWNVNNLRKYFH